MEFRTLGASGLKVSTVGIGLNNLGGRIDRAASLAVVGAALDVGITLFDTADVYPQRNGGRSEELLGEGLGRRREEIVLATKFGMSMDESGRRRGASRRYIMAEVEASLRRLRTDYIDLYQIHAPDDETPIEETLRALDDLVRAGKVRYIGTSNFAGWQISEAVWTARYHGLTRPCSTQTEYSLLERTPERELLPALAACDVALLPYFPLASGMLTGKYRAGQAVPGGTRLAAPGGLRDRFLHDANLAIVERLEAFCAQRGHTLLELAFSWLLAHDVVGSVIAGATSPEQVRQNVAAAGWKLSADELANVDRLT